MYRLILTRAVLASLALCLASAAMAQTYPRGPDELGSNPPVFQTIGMLDTEAHFLVEEDCRVCHESGVPGRHHNLYGQPIPDGSFVPYPDTNGDGVDDENYSCLSCHGPDFALVRDCFECHPGNSPHHVGQDSFNRQCTVCHGDLVDDYDDGHYIPTYDASEVTPWTGLHGEGWNDSAHTDPYRESDGSGIVNEGDILELDTGITFTWGDTLTRTDPKELRWKPTGDDNDFMIDDPGRSGSYTYNVIFLQGGTLGAVWNPNTDTLTVTVAPTQTAQQIVDTINAAVPSTGNRVRATKLLTDGSGDLLEPEEYAPLGGDPFNYREFGAGSCSYCHDHDGALDVNGDLSPELIVDNHDTHHHNGLVYYVSDGAGGSWRKCNICHDYRAEGGGDGSGSYHDQSGPAFDLHIRVCEQCHGPESLHNIQADSPAEGNIGEIVVGGELPGYGHVGADGGPGASDCWGCHGFGFEASGTAPFSGPVIPTVYNSDTSVMTAGTETTVILNGTGFVNKANGEIYTSVVQLTGPDGTTVDLEPDILMDEGVLSVTIPATTAPGNYQVRAKKDDLADGAVTSNPMVLAITPKTEVSSVSTRRGRTTISGTGFGGFAEGSGTKVSGTYTKKAGRRVRTYSMPGQVSFWNDGQIVVTFKNVPRTVTVTSVFGMDTYVISSN